MYNEMILSLVFMQHSAGTNCLTILGTVAVFKSRLKIIIITLTKYLFIVF